MHSLFFVFIYILVVDIIWKTICYVVQYAVHTELCSTNLFFLDFLLFIGTFFNKKFIEGFKLNHVLCFDDNVTALQLASQDYTRFK